MNTPCSTLDTTMSTEKQRLLSAGKTVQAYGNGDGHTDVPLNRAEAWRSTHTDEQKLRMAEVHRPVVHRITLQQWRKMEATRVEFEAQQTCLQKYCSWPLIAVCVLLCIGLVLCFTVFRAPLAPHAADILKFGSIPIVSAIFTYMHIWLALHMTFYPLEFIGLYNFQNRGIGLGWQGIVPMKAAVMAEKAVDLMTQKLLRVEDIFSRIDPARVAQEMGPTLRGVLTHLINELAMQQSPEMWVALPEAVRQEAIQKACEEAPAMIEAMMSDVRNNIKEVFDLKGMVVNALVRDKALLNEMFLKCGAREFTYTKVLGAKIGFCFGVIQMGVWFFYQAWWILPLTGFLGGYLTNWLALTMIFQPVEPHVLCCGCYTLHGLFLKRQMEVSDVYASLVVGNILKVSNIVDAIIRGPSSEKLFAIMSKHIGEGVDQYAGVNPMLVHMVVGSEQYTKAKNHVCDHTIQHLPQYLSNLEDYAHEAMDLENTIFDKMAALPSADFERLLHPVFEEDEWKLIILGALLGVVVGLGQFYALGG